MKFHFLKVFIVNFETLPTRNQFIKKSRFDLMVIRDEKPFAVSWPSSDPGSGQKNTGSELVARVHENENSSRMVMTS